MRHRKTKLLLASVGAVILFLVSMTVSTNAATLPASSSMDDAGFYSPSTYTLSQFGPDPEMPESGTNVGWYQDTNITSDEWSWNNRNWLFGPRPSYEIYHENGTLLNDNSFAEIDEIINIVVTVPKGIFTAGADISRVSFYGWYMIADNTQSANFDFGFDSYMSEVWYMWSDQWDSSFTGPSYPTPGFADIHPDQCYNTSDSDNYYLAFAISFNENTPLGMYELHMQVQDTDNINIGSYGYQSEWKFSGLAIGMIPDLAFMYSYGGSYTLEKVDLAGNLLYSVSRNQDFVMRYNITGDIEYALLGFRMPYWMDILTNVTEWHDELVTSYGAWQLDEATGIYVWNASLEVTYMQHVFGQHEVYRWQDIGAQQEMNVTVLREEWNEESGTWDRYLMEELQYFERQFFFIYNATTDSFETMYGYTYYGYPYDEYVEDTWNEEVRVLEPIPDNYPQFYVLNENLSIAQTIGQELVVEFVGHFTDEMPVTANNDYYSFDDRVMGPNDWHYGPATWGENPKQTYSEYEIARRISVERPVTIASILREDGSEPGNWMFQVDIDENFLVEGLLQGGGNIAESIDGVEFSLSAWDGYWTEEESSWSELTYEINLDMSGVPSFNAYNFTEKNNYTYGLYWDWTYVNMTGWHDEYNSDTNTWDWVYSEYESWEWQEVEGYHMVWYCYNQRTNEWQIDWIPRRSVDTVVSTDFASTSGFTSSIVNGDLLVSFMVSLSQNVPETNYQWDFKFMNNTWYEDYSGTWGEHEILTWDREWVYSFDFGGERVYMDALTTNQLAFQFTNGSLGTDYMKGLETPYIEINDQKLPISVTEYYDPWSGTTWNDMFYYDHYDPSNGKDYYYYELTNGTRIDVTYRDTVFIYNVTAGNGDSFLTSQEWDYWFFNEGISSYYWIDLEGIIHQGGSEYATYNCEVVIFDEIEATYGGEAHFLRYGEDSLLKVHSWSWSSRDSVYYVTGIDGILYTMKYDNIEYDYFLFIDNEWVRCSWFEYYEIGIYEGVEVVLVGSHYNRVWYTSIDEVDYELPFVGASQFYDWTLWGWELNNLVADGGIVPSTKSLIYNDEVYPVFEISASWYSSIDEITYSLGINYLEYTTANGTSIWDITPTGSEATIGTFDDSFVFNQLETFQYDSYDDNGWPNHYSGETYIFELLNGTSWLVVNSDAMMVYEYLYEGTTFYTMQDWPDWTPDGNHEYRLINGSTFQVPDWDSATIVGSSVVYRYEGGPGSVFDFMGETYEIIGWYHSYGGFKVLNASTSETLFIPWSNFGQRIFEFDYLATTVVATANYESVGKIRTTYGYQMLYGPQPVESDVFRNFYDLVIGIPEWGMWGYQNWAINPENGALDLDGDLDTVDDQYFVQEEYESTDSWTHEYERMDVFVGWDPNGTVWGDEMNLNSWMGLDRFSWSYEWSQTFYWFDTDMNQLSQSEMDAVIDTVVTVDGDSKPGYWDISWMAQNVTWEDLLAQAEANDWDWISSNEQTWTWMSFGVGQNYGTSMTVEDVEHRLEIGMHYEFSGLMLWEDLDMNGQMDVNMDEIGSAELSHYLIPDYVEAVRFVSPGMAYGNRESSDAMHLNVTDEVTWGVQFRNINGTIYPFSENSYWGWYDSFMTGSDMRTFDERPTDITIDEISFLVHFRGYISNDSLNNYVDVKIDNYVGNWDVDMIGGRDNLENRSLALNYFADVSTQDFAFKANGSLADNEMTVSSDVFEFETGSAQFAKMIMGGVTYDWGKNTSTPHDVVCYTTPLGAFRAAYESDNGRSATSWSFNSEMFYVTIGFPEWDGYSVYQDPLFVGYVSRAGASSGTGPGQSGFGAISINPQNPTESESVRIGVDVFFQGEIYDVELLYSTDQEFSSSTSMWGEGENHYVGIIPSHEGGTTVYFMVRVHSILGVFDSQIGYYTVRSAEMEFLITIIALGLGGVVALVMGRSYKRRRKR